MPGATTKIIYEPDHRSTDCYVAFVNGPEYEKYKSNPSSVPLVSVVESFEIFFSGTGPTGKVGQASKQQLDTVFGSTKDTEAIAKLLELGRLQKGGEIGDGCGTTNKARGTQTGGYGGR